MSEKTKDKLTLVFQITGQIKKVILDMFYQKLLFCYL